MKKILIVITIFLMGFIAARFLMGGSEDTWLCQDGQWVKHGNPSADMPTDGCSQEESGGIIKALEKAKDINKDSKTLDVSGQGLESLTAEFFNDNTNAIYLDVSKNNLTGALPAEIRKMSGLKELNASHNNLTGIPAEIGQLSNIEKIDFSYNNIDTMPNEIVNISGHLQQLNLMGNGYSAEQMEAFQVMLPNTDIIF